MTRVFIPMILGSMLLVPCGLPSRRTESGAVPKGHPKMVKKTQIGKKQKKGTVSKQPT